MKRLYLSFFSCLLALSLQAAEKPVLSSIKEVTVFLNGAQVVREGEVQLLKGNNTLIFKDLPSSLNPSSLQVEGAGNFLVLSVSHGLDYLTQQQKGKEVPGLEQQLEKLQEQIAEYESLLSVYQEEERLLLENRQLGGTEGLSVERLKEAADFYRSRLKEIKLKELELKKQIRNWKSEEEKLKNNMREARATKEDPSSTVYVKVDAGNAGLARLRLSYLVEQAGWLPAYDLRVKEVEEPLALHYKAKVFQLSGEDWSGVQLTISTGNPEADNSKPQLQAQWVNFPENVRWQAGRNLPVTKAGMVQGQVKEATTGEPIPGVSVRVKGTTVGVATNFDGYYSISLPAGSQTLVFSFIGFVEQEIPILKRSSIDILLEEDVRQLEEVVVTGFSGRASGVTNRQKKVAAVSPDVARVQNHISSEFIIQQPYTIPSDGKEYMVNMQQQQLPAHYQYYAAPAIEEAAFLTAGITNWQEIALLTGEANLFFEGKYVGKTLLDPLQTTDTITISLGKDKDVQVERKELKDYSKSSFFSGKKKEEKTFLLLVRNGKQKPVHLILEDRVPRSKISDISVEVSSLSGGEFNEENGVVHWDLTLNRGENLERTLSYTLKYPGSRKIILYE